MLHKKELSHPKYRADIDGLRAIAVLLVVFFHATELGGGFVGVDIFFVISGFLISTIIFNNLDSNSFSFGQFYIRRILRIFPALLLVLASCGIFGWFALFPDEYKQLNNHIFRSSFFVSNFALLKESGDYFNNSSNVKPLLHLWSLAIEEQFYILWPLILWLSWKRKLSFFSVIIILLTSSFVFNLFTVYQNKNAAFYLPQSRFWELLIGSLLAYITNYKTNANSKNFITNFLHKNTIVKLEDVISILGIFLIFVAVFLLTKNNNFPGAWALLPTVGAALIIFAGPNAFFNRTILQNNILVWFGLISFPLYLWHWPLLSFAQIIESQTPSIAIKSAAVLLSIILAWLTYYFVEKPIRFKIYNKKITIILLIVMMILVGLIARYSYDTNRFAVYQKDSHDLATPYQTRKSDGSCENFGLGLSANPRNIVCLTNAKDPQVLIVGDSHAMALNSAAYLNQINLKTLLIAAHSCLPFNKYNAKTKFEKECQNLVIKVQEAAKLKSIKTIVINNYGPQQEDFAKYNFVETKTDHQKKQEEFFVDQYNQFIKDLIATKKNVVFVIDNPRLSYDPKACVARLFKQSATLNCTTSKEKILQQESILRKLLEEIKKQNPQLKIFDSANTFCDESVCYAKDEKNILYWDAHHISVAGSKKLLTDLIKFNKI